jgi:hypothetical protein
MLNRGIFRHAHVQGVYCGGMFTAQRCFWIQFESKLCNKRISESQLRGRHVSLGIRFVAKTTAGVLRISSVILNLTRVNSYQQLHSMKWLPMLTPMKWALGTTALIRHTKCNPSWNESSRLQKLGLAVSYVSTNIGGQRVAPGPTVSESLIGISSYVLAKMRACATLRQPQISPEVDLSIC